ncbi:hypothetical protein N752_00975 [Desulforamulus aquiferis]|nr:hypothetical protein [Desulforamulus aquiferis]RYD07187.1 hypothetical protein N752_00975 [Desulforamulus aquiferis]
MRYRTLKLLARQYRLDSDIFIRRDIIRKIFESDRMAGLEVFGKMVGSSVAYLYELGEISQLKKKRNRCRRQRNKKEDLTLGQIRELKLAEAREIAWR